VQHTATHCNTLQHTATHCNTTNAIGCMFLYYVVLQCVAVCCSAVQHTATHCNTLQHTATHCNTTNAIGCMFLHYVVLQCVAVCCSAVQHTATHCNTLQHYKCNRLYVSLLDSFCIRLILCYRVAMISRLLRIIRLF